MNMQELGYYLFMDNQEKKQKEKQNAETENRNKPKEEEKKTADRHKKFYWFSSIGLL